MPIPRLPRRWFVAIALCLAPTLAVGLLLLWLYLPTAAQSPQPGAGDEGPTVFTRDDGLASNSVTALGRDDRFLWIGTTAGLTRYTLQGREAGLRWQTFTARDGMAADAVSDLWHDAEGGLWVTHPEGEVSLFDRGDWVTFENLTQTLEQAYDQIVEREAEGPLWALEKGGRAWTILGDTVGYYVGAVWRPYGEAANLPRGRLIAVWSDGEGAWVVSENGQLGYFDGVGWTVFNNAFDAVQRQYELITASGPTVSPLWLVDREGAVWVRNAFNGRDPRPDVRRFFEGRWTNFGSGDGMATGFVAELRLDAHERVWARHLADENGEGGGLSLYYGEPPESLLLPDRARGWDAFIPAYSGNVTDFWPHGTEGVWIASAYRPPGGGVPVGGLSYVTLNTWERFSLNNLPGGNVSDAWLDQEGDLWLGLSSDARGLGGGLWRYRPAQATRPGAWIAFQGLLGDDVRDLWGDGQGALWVATLAGVNRITLRNRRVASYTLPLPPDQIGGDGQGNLWAVALGRSDAEEVVWRWDGDDWAGQTVSEGLSGGPYADMLVADDGRVYLAGERGLDIGTGDEWKRFAALPGRHVQQVWQDRLGDLWLTSEITPGRPFNLSLNRGAGWETLLKESDTRVMGPEPLAFVRDGLGRAWMGTSQGLFVHDLNGKGAWRGLGPMEGLPVGPVSALYADAGGTLWVAVEDKVYRTDYRTDYRRAGWAWHRLSPQVGVVRRVVAGPEGSVLFAGDEGVALYHPNVPELRLDEVENLITGEVSDGQAPVVLTLGRNAAQIALSVDAPTLPAAQLAYRYRLQGIDEDWRFLPASSMGGKRATIVYAGLSSGVYTFTAAVRNDALDYSSPVTLALYVSSRPPELYLDRASVAGRPAEQPTTLQAFVDQPIQIQLSGSDDQPQPLVYRYRIQGLEGGWTTTTRPVLSFTLSAADTYTFVATALDEEGQSSPPVGAQIVVHEREAGQDSVSLPWGTLAVVLGAAAILSIGAALLLALRRRRRESW